MGTNRDNVRKLKKGRGWSYKCDMIQFSDGQKCPNCGNKHGVHREKYRRSGISLALNSYLDEFV